MNQISFEKKTSNFSQSRLQAEEVDSPRTFSSMPVAEAIDSVKRYYKALLVWALSCLCVGTVYLEIAVPQFVATSAIILSPTRQTSGGNASSSESNSVITLDSSQVESQIQVLKSERVLSYVFKVYKLGKAETKRQQSLDSNDSQPTEDVAGTQQDPIFDEISTALFEQFAARMSARRVGQSYVIEVSYQSADPLESARIANAIVMQYIKLQIELKASAIQRGNEYLKGRIERINSQYKAALEGVRAGKIPDLQFPDADVQVISSAAPPLRKSSPKTALTLAICLTFALFTSFIAILFANILNKTVRSSSQIVHLLEVPCYGIVSKRNRERNKSIAQLRHWAHLKLRRTGRSAINPTEKMGASIFLSLPGLVGRSIGLYCWNDEGSMRLVVSRLEEVYRAQKRSLQIIKFIDDTHRVASSSQERRPESVTDIVHAINAEAKNELEFAHATANFQTGSEFMCAYSELGLTQIDNFFGGRRGSHDVIIDMPPMLVNPDGLACCKFLDCVIFVIDEGKTSLEDASDALLAIKRAGAKIVGTVLVR